MAHKEDSLWTLLNNYIKERGQITYGELCQKVAEEGYKVETATRRLRKSESPSVEAIRAISKRSTEYISGYKWIGEPVVHEAVHSTAPKGTLFVYKVDPKYVISELRDPN